MQYIRFPLGEAAQCAITDGRPLVLVVDHPAYAARALLPDGVRASLAADVADAATPERALREVHDGR